MKKLLLIAMVAFGFAANAQGQFNLGLNLGLPLGDTSDGSSFVISPEASYLFNVSDEFQLGPSVSYLHFFGKEKEIAGVKIKGKDGSFLPVAAAARFNASEQFVLGADLGYAVGISPEGAKGGFYYRPMAGYNVSDNIMLQLAYSGVSVSGSERTVGGVTIKTDGASASAITLGAVFKL